MTQTEVFPERAPRPDDEEQRLIALEDYQLHHEGGSDEALDRITRLCCRFIAVPISFISLVYKDKLIVKSVYGADFREASRDASLCAYVVGNQQPFIVTDASIDNRFSAASVVVGPPYIRFYAGAPLITPHGHCIGTLCIADPAPRKGVDSTLEVLQQLAAIVIDELELRRISAELSCERKRAHHANLELSRVNAELNQAKEEAEQASRAKSEFLAGISHELRTPLNAVLGFAQVLEQDADDQLSAGQARYVEQILKGGRNLLGLIDELLDLARIESNRIDMHEQCFEIMPLLNECATLLQALAQEHDVHVEVDYHDGSLLARADRSRVLQVVQNLVTNAIKYNRPGGWVTVEARSIAAVWVRLAIRDSGLGIPLPRQRELFHPFSQMGRESSAIEGNGVGLAAAKRLVEQMGGQISFSSEEGVGSIFWVDLRQA